MHRRLITFVAVAALIALQPSAAGADGGGDAFSDGDQVGADARDGGDASNGVPTRGGHSLCRFESLDAEGIATAEMMVASGWVPAPPPGPGTWYRKICDNPNGQSTATVVWLRARPVDTADLARQASDRTPIPLPEVHLNPPEGGEQVVNLSTWLWIDRSVWQPVSAEANAGGVTVTATAVPESVSWAMGNGDTVNCSGPGTAYDPHRPSSDQRTDCSYVYRRSSASVPGGAFTATATITWNVTWTAMGAAGGGDLGTVTRATAFPVRVSEIQAVNR